MRIIIPGGSGQVGRLLRGACSSGDTRSSCSAALPPRARRSVAWDAGTLGPWARGTRGSGCRHQPRRPQRQLPLPPSEPPRNHGFAGAIDCASSARRSRTQRGRPMSGSRPAPRRSTRIVPMRPTMNPRESSAAMNPMHLRPGVSASMSPRRGRTQPMKRLRREPARYDALRHGHEPRPWRNLRHASHAGATRPWRTRRAGRPVLHSWVHEADFVEAVLWLIAHDEVAGPVNVASPNPLTQIDFMRGFGKPMASESACLCDLRMLKMGARLLGTETELVLKSRRVIPGRLLAGQFRFRYPNGPMWRPSSVPAGESNAPPADPGGAHHARSAADLSDPGDHGHLRPEMCRRNSIPGPASGACPRCSTSVASTGLLEAASAQQVAAQIARCPSGALQWYGPGQSVPESDQGEPGTN